MSDEPALSWLIGFTLSRSWEKRRIANVVRCEAIILPYCQLASTLVGQTLDQSLQGDETYFEDLLQLYELC